MSQSRKASAAEALTNLVVGSIINILITQGVSIMDQHWTWFHNEVPWFTWQVSLASNFIMTSIFTIVSFIRSYVIRRAFNMRVK